jgi:hypothetical protein
MIRLSQGLILNDCLDGVVVTVQAVHLTPEDELLSLLCPGQCTLDISLSHSKLLFQL